MISSVFNILVRLATLISKFLLIIFLAKFLDPVQFGLYGLIVAAIIFSLYFVGLDFYTYSTRELLKKNKSQWGKVFKSHIVLCTILYLIFLPVLIWFCHSFNLLPNYLFIPFIMILILEHINQELNRVCIVLKKPIVANFGLFCRSGLWPLVVIITMHTGWQARSLNTVLIDWVVGDIIGIFFQAGIIHQTHISGWKEKIDISWILKGVKIATPFLIATLSYRFINTIDKYWLKQLTDLRVVGAYTFFSSISGSLLSFLDAGVLSIRYPKMIEHYNSGNKNLFINEMQLMTKQLLFYIVLFTLISVISLPIILNYLNKSIYSDLSFIFYIMLCTQIFCSISYIPHYILYAQNKDRVIIFSQVFSALLFIVVSYFLLVMNIGSILSISFGMLFSQFFLLIAKGLYAKKIIEKEVIL